MTNNITYSNYCLEKPCQDGTVISVQLTGEETFLTCCPNCEAEVRLGFEEFFGIVRGGDIYSTSVCCDRCSTEMISANKFAAGK